jgi:excisionase family DNA binding protein
MQADIEGPLIGLKNIAKKLVVSRRTVHRIIKRGELPTLKIGRWGLVRLAELRRWLETLSPSLAMWNWLRSSQIAFAKQKAA